MTPAEAAVLLARIAASDNREVTETAARAWSESLPDVVLADALDYLPDYYREATRESRNWIYPGDVLKGVQALHDARRNSAGRKARVAYLGTADPDDPDAELQAIREAVKARKEYDVAHPAPSGPLQIEPPPPPKPEGWEYAT